MDYTVRHEFPRGWARAPWRRYTVGVVFSTRSRRPRARLIPLVLLIAGSTACAMIAGIESPPPPTAEAKLPPRDTPAAPAPDDDTAPSDAFTLKPTLVEGLDLGSVRCNTPKQDFLTITNKLATEATYDVALPAGTDLTLVGGADPLRATGVVQPGTSATIGISASPTTAGELVVPLAITFNGEAVRMPVKVNGRGAVLRVTPNAVDFGQVRYQVGSTIAVTVENVGNEHAKLTNIVTLVPGTDGFDVTPKTAEIGPTGRATITAQLLASAAATPKATREVEFVTQDPQCATAAKLKLEGERITTDVTVSPATLDWGKRGCNTPHEAKPVTIQNYDAATAAAWTVTLPNNSGFEVEGGVLSGSVPAAVGGPTSTTISFKPKQLSVPETISEDATIAITGPAGAGNRTVRLRKDIRGVVYQVTPTLIEDFSRKLGEPAQIKSARIKNVGNESAAPRYSITQIAGGGFTVEPDDLPLVPRSFFDTDDIDVTFLPTEEGNFEADVAVLLKSPTPQWPLCNQPISLKVKGVGNPP
jgi:hypothetical protein